MENQIIDKFLKGRAVSSARIYRHEISKFSAFLSALGKDISNAGTGELDAYHMELSNRNLTPATMKRAFSMITGFLKFQAKQNPEYHAPVSARGDLIKYSSACYAESDQFKDILAKFGGWIPTAGTRETYLPAILRFFAITGKRPEEIIHDDILHWVKTLRERVSVRTVRLHQSAVAKFSAFLRLQKHPAIPPELLRKESLNLPRRGGQQKPSILTPEEIRNLLNHIRSARTEIAMRDHALFSLIFCCALRVGEAVNMKTGHLVFEPGRVKVFIHGRKNKRDIVQTMEFTEKADLVLLQSVRQWAEKSGTGKEEPLFCPVLWTRKRHCYSIRPGTGIAEREMEKRFRKWGAESGVRSAETKGAIHTLRHSRATDLLKNRKWDVAGVRDFMAHSSIATTDVYLH